MHNARYFAVGPVRELGDDLPRAIGAMGGESQQRFARAHGFVLVQGERPLRLAVGVDLAEAHRHALRDHARLGAAVALAGEQVIYRELAAAPVAKASGQHRSAVTRAASSASWTRSRVRSGAQRRAPRPTPCDASSTSSMWTGPISPMRTACASCEPPTRRSPVCPRPSCPRCTEVLDLEAGRVVRGTRRSVKQTFSLKISSDFARTDERIAQFVARSQTNFIRDEYGRRQIAFSEKARSDREPRHRPGARARRNLAPAPRSLPQHRA